MKFSCLALACKAQKTAMPSVQRGTRLFAKVSSSDTTDRPPFPLWLKLAAFAPVSHRRDLTVEVADRINDKSGGFVSDANLLSDMVTSILVEDIEPKKIPDFWLSLKELDMQWTDASKEQLELCQQLLSESGNVPPEIQGLVQLTWQGAEGKLKHQIPLDW